MNLSIPEIYLKSVVNGVTAPPILDDIITREVWYSNEPIRIQQAPLRSVSDCVDIATSDFQRGPWRGYSRSKRRDVLLSWAKHISDSSSKLSLLNCAETGRALSEIRTDSVPKAISALVWFAEAIDKHEDRSLHPGNRDNDFAVVKQEPVGVVAAILPWNDPLVTLMWKVAPALAAGNTVIVKPSEQATAVVVAAVKLAHSAGVPMSTLQVLTGNGEVGDLLITHAAVDMIAFTGSTRTAQKIVSRSHAVGIRRTALECGGKGPFILGRESSDLKKFSSVVARNIFYNQGQVCSAPSIILVPRGSGHKIANLVQVEAIRYCPDTPTEGKVGYMISRSAVSGVRDLLSSLEDRNFWGELSDRRLPPRSCALSMTPTIIVDLSDESELLCTELFAPVLIIKEYDLLEDAITFCNKCPYGLAGGVWSDNLDECIHVASALRVGNMHVNSWGDDGNSVPFGGIKNSGYGREKSLSTFDDYTHTKSIYIRAGFASR